MSFGRTKIGEKDGKEIFLFTLDNNKGLRAEILNYGGIVKRLIYKGTDVALGRETLEEYFENEGYFGALIGRNTNLIENAKITLSGKNYELSSNNGRHNLHGGKEGFDKKVWSAKELGGEEPALVLKTYSSDGEEGFPGNVSVTVTYTLTKDNSFKIKYQGETDKDTVFNMTNHTYFNLNGHKSGKIYGHELIVYADFYTQNNEEGLPTGEILTVKDTPFDFNGKKKLEKVFTSNHKQIKMFNGIDHNFVLSGRGFRKVGMLAGEKSGIKMEIYTDRPGMQVYMGNEIEAGKLFKDGAEYAMHDGICLETQAFPNCFKFSHFPNSILKKNEKYDSVTEYKFKI